ncbi:MAG: TfuA-like protein [Rhizobiales bacterium]|nr:TfuA-like protein [Hyphomicrobiales bacterium]
MKVLFAGPSCAKLLPSLRSHPAFELRGPAAYGDVARAVLEGANAIGIVDGRFEDTRAVWHKEILFGLSKGVAIAGAASMGALRASECAAFGMIGIGAVYRRYVSGEFDDDGDVAQLHGPAELGFLALSEPLANIVATLEALEAEGLISARESSALNLLARGLHYKERGYRRLFESAALPDHRRAILASWAERNAVDQKADDAALLVEWLIAAPNDRQRRSEFTFSETSQWLALLEEIESQKAAA